MRKKLTLSQILSIKTCVEKLIQSTTDEIIKCNSSDTSVDSLLLRYKKLGEQLVHLKEVIQTTNQVKYGKTSNNTRIYTLSNLSTERRMYETISKSTSKKKMQISKSKAKALLGVIDAQMKTIEEQLTIFNNKTKVTVYIDPTLDLLGDYQEFGFLRRLFQRKK